MELVVLVDEQNNPIGTAPKATVHTVKTPLHRAFSLFLFNKKGELLLTKRSKNKKTFPGVWTNSVCGHVSPGEETKDAVVRRLKDELRITDIEVKQVAPYRYKFADSNGIVENEICPVFVAYTDGIINPNVDEVDEWRWMDWKEFLEEIKKSPGKYSPWSGEEAQLIAPLI